MTKVVPLRSFDSKPDAEIALLHSPFYPVELYEGEQINASLIASVAGIRKSWTMRVWRLSPLGVEVLVDPSGDLLNFVRKGMEVDLNVRLGKHVSEFTGLVVESVHSENSLPLVGIRWCAVRDRSDGQMLNERRRHERWLCGIDFLPTGIAPNPIRFNDFIHFKVRDLSLEGMQLYTSLRNKYLIPGMTLDSVISLPMTGDVKFQLKIVNTRILGIDGKDYLCLGTKILQANDNILEVLGQYIFQFGPKTSIQELKDRGFKIRAPSSAIEFGFVRSAEDYREVLSLRHMAYSAVGKLPKEAMAEEAADIYDSRARILTARYRGDLVASARLMFHSPEDGMEHEQFVKFPKSFPRKDQIAELRLRICTHPEFRGSDLFFGIMRHITLTTAQSNRSWILGSAEPKLVSAYTRLGYEKTGVFYRHKDLGDVPHEVLLGDLTKMLSGRGVGVSLWNELYADLSYYLDRREQVEFDPFMNLRMGIYRALRPVSAFLTSSIRAPKRK